MIDTARAIRLVIARLGPNVWKNSSRPTTSAATPPATMSPAARMTGTVRAAAARAAAVTPSPFSSSRRIADMRKTE